MKNAKIFLSKATNVNFAAQKKLREAQENDPVFLTTKDFTYSGMLADALKQNDIPFIKKEKHGGILKYTGLGLGIEEFSFYVPFSEYEKAKGILAEIFTETDNVFVYKIKNSLYINLTNECPCMCEFCIRSKGEIEGYNLWLTREPSAEEVIDLIKKESGFDEVVFSGFGEPTKRPNHIKRIAAYAKTINKKTRLDTNGLGNLINGGYPTDITKYLKDIDTVSVSLNAADEESYNKITNPIYPNAYKDMLKFTAKCIARGIKTIMTVVDVIGQEEIEKCRKIAEGLGAEFRVREMIN